MQNFNFNLPTEIVFGKDCVSSLGKKAAPYGKNVLVMYGGGSVKRNGVLDKVLASLDGYNITELGGVEPNPRITTVRKGIAVAKEKKIDFIVAVGGGSTIDCAKAVAGGVYFNDDPWLFMLDNSFFPTKALPLLTVLTLAATGSEMNGNFVITNWETNDKLACFSPFIIPKVSFMDPEFTFTVNKYQTACGTADIMSHIFEVYFDPNDEAFVSDKLCEALLLTCIKYGPVAVKDPTDYEARSNLMWAGTLAINKLLNCGKQGVSWAVHGMEHQLSAYHDITHGAGLAILTPAWMEYVLCDKTVDKFARYAEAVWGIKDDDKYAAARQAISRTKYFFASLGLPSTQREAGIKEKYFAEMAEKAHRFSDTEAAYFPLKEEDIVKIYEKCY